MECAVEKLGNGPEIPEDQRNGAVNGTEGKDDNSEESTQTSTNNGAPDIVVLHEDVRKYIESYVQQQGYNDVTMDVEAGSNLGDNFMGFIGRLTVTGVDQNGQKKMFNWIVKTAPNLESYRSVMNISIAYERESYLYKDVFRIFDDFQNDKHALEPFNEHPGYVLSHLEDMRESIVMEDMKSIGFVMSPRQKPLDLNHVKLVMKAYAKLHAMSYVLKDQKPDVFKSIAENVKDIMVSTLLTQKIHEAQHPLMEKALSSLDPIQDAKFRPPVKKFLDNYREIIAKLLDDINDRAVIGHGDSWVNNMLWKYDVPELGIPSKVCLVDWQLSRYGSPACDLSYFLFTCTTKEFRDKHYDSMINLYYYTLCAHMSELGSDAQKYLPFEALQEELKKYSLVGFFTTLMVLIIITKDSNEIPEWRSDDLDQEELQQQWMKASRNSDAYNIRIRGVILDYYEKGYFNDLL